MYISGLFALLSDAAEAEAVGEGFPELSALYDFRLFEFVNSRGRKLVEAFFGCIQHRNNFFRLSETFVDKERVGFGKAAGIKPPAIHFYIAAFYVVAEIIAVEAEAAYFSLYLYLFLVPVKAYGAKLLKGDNVKLSVNPLASEDAVGL